VLKPGLFAKPFNPQPMRHQPENHDWTDPAAHDHDSGRPHKPDQQKDTANSHVKDEATPPAPPEKAPSSSEMGKGASRKRKLEDLNDREDLSERLFSDRNLF
jgi:hypothetical protein